MTEYVININGIAVNARYEDHNIHDIFIPLLQDLTDLYKKNKRRILAFLAAPPGAGKSTLANFLETLSSELPDIEEVQAIGMDGFHRRQDYLLTHTIMRDGKEVKMLDVKGSPETFDLKKLEGAIKDVSSGKTCGWPVYERLLHNPVEDAITVEKNIILLEGNYLLLNIDGWERLASYADYTIKIQAPLPMIRKRLIDRRIASGHSPETAGEFVDFSDMYNARLCTDHFGKADLTLHLNTDGSFSKEAQGI